MGIGNIDYYKYYRKINYEKGNPISYWSAMKQHYCNITMLRSDSFSVQTKNYMAAYHNHTIKSLSNYDSDIKDEFIENALYGKSGYNLYNSVASKVESRYIKVSIFKKYIEDIIPRLFNASVYKIQDNNSYTEFISKFIEKK